MIKIAKYRKYGGRYGFFSKKNTLRFQKFKSCALLPFKK